MARTVTIELDVQDAKAVAAWQRSKDSIAQFHQQLDGVDKSNQKNKNSANAFFGEVKRGIGATAAAITGITGVVGGMLAVVQQLRAEYDNIVQRQRNSADATRTYEQNLAQAVRNAVGIFSAQETKTISEDLARSAGIDNARAAALVGSALTSTGVQNEADARLAISSAAAAARFAPDLDLASQESLAGVAAGIAKKSNISPESAIGFMSRVGQQANIKDLSQQVKNLAPGIPSLQQFGFSEGEAGSLLATISQQTFDEEGAITLTSSLAFADSLRERFRDNKRFQNADGSFNPIAAITAMQQDPELRKRFLEGGTFDSEKFGDATMGRGRAKPAFEALLQRGTKVARQFAGGVDAIGSFADGEQSYSSLVEDIASVTPVSRTQRALEAGTARIASTSPQAISGVLRDNLAKLQQAVGSSSLAQKIAALAFEVETDFGTSPNAALRTAIGGLSDVQQDLLTAEAPRTITTGRGFTTLPGRTVSQRDRDVASEIDTVVTELRNLIRAMENGGVRADVNLNVNGNAQVAAEPQPRAAALGAR